MCYMGIEYLLYEDVEYRKGYPSDGPPCANYPAHPPKWEPLLLPYLCSTLALQYICESAAVFLVHDSGMKATMWRRVVVPARQAN
jgi:hypothetical protein